MKKTLIILAIILLTLSVNAQCINNDDCSTGEVCEDGECRTKSILTIIADDIPAALLALFVTGEQEEDDGGGKKIYYTSETPCFEDWVCLGWTACISGKKIRTCTDRNDCETENFKPAESMLCSLSPTASCNDGILNQNEEQVDCGGPCPPCNNCYDNKQNCHSGDCEEGLDCGGPCMPCKHALPIMLIIITAIIVIILIILGIWYWKIRETGELVGKTVKEFKPPIQPSSRIGI